MKVLFLGNLEIDKVVAAPSKVGNEIFKLAMVQYVDVKFFAYFQDGTKYSRFKKLFGKKKIKNNIIIFGLIPFILNVIKFRPNVVHITSISVYYLVAFPFFKIFGSKIFYNVHNVNKYTLEKYSFIGEILKRKILYSEKISVLYSSKVFVLSKMEKQYLLTNYKIPNDKVVIVDNGINLLNINKQYDYNLEILKIITVGSLDRKEKGLDNLINILKDISYSVQLTVCSFQKPKNKVDNISENLTIIWKDPLDEINLRKEFTRSDYFVTLSEYESFGIALLEAMNTGLLFLATDRIGLTERFNQELRNFIIPYGEWEIAKDKLKNLIALPLKEKSELSNKIIKFSTNFTWEKVVEKYFELYENI